MRKIFLTIIFLGFFIPTSFIFGATGTIDATNKYCWSNNTGWINFGCTNCNVLVSDTEITGYVFSDNFGWINLQPTNGGVNNTTSGVLSGYAWGQSAGWINFSGTTINTSTGEFSGTATGDIVGTINFDCSSAGCPVTTSWRPTTTICGDGVCDVTESCSTCPDDCGPCGCSVYHNECNSEKRCISVCGAGDNQCSVSDDCETHNECNTQKQCVQIRGVGLNQCQIDSDCLNTYNQCISEILEPYPGSKDPPQIFNYCIVVDGLGINQCQNNIDCANFTHNECNALKQCVAVDGLGVDTCLTSNDCLNTHNECNLQNQCVAVWGVGLNQCFTDSNCQPPKHNECTIEDKCIVVDGPGINQCQTDSECKRIDQPRFKCNEQMQCVMDFSPGTNECKIDNDCLKKHNECSGSQCVSVIGLGINQCNNNSDCQSGSVYNDCNEQKKCVLVSGSGSNKCQTDDDCKEIIQVTHNECNEQKQCISVPGAGNNQCNSSDDCIIHSVCNFKNQCILEKGQGIDQCKTNEDCNIFETITLETKKTIQSPQGSIITKTVSTTGLLVTSIAAVSFLSLFDLFLVLSRIFNFLLVLFGLRKKAPPWGVVYDSVTKQPLDPAYVILKDLQGKQIASAITDIDGRYGFLISSGNYIIQAYKTNYFFPSQKLLGKIKDEFYEDLYFGENIEIKKDGDVIIKNIPLDPIKFDWNEFAKKEKKLTTFYSKWHNKIRKIYDFLFILGFIFAVFSWIFAPYPYNAIVAILYLLFILFRILGLKSKTYGYIINGTTGEPLSFAILKIIIPDSEQQVAVKFSDKYGRYYCLVPPGKYYVKIEKKNEDGSYSLIYTSQIINTSKSGIIKEKFKI